MKILYALVVIFLSASSIKSEDDELHTSGPVASIMENLAQTTSEVTHEIHFSLESKIDKSIDSLLGDIQVITANAMTQLTDLIFEANQKLTTCPQIWSMQDLLERIDKKLTNCTLNLQDLRANFQNNAIQILQGIQMYATELTNLTAQCQFLSDSSSFTNSTMCFVQKLTELNQNIGLLINQANISLMRTRQMARSNVNAATTCTDDVAVSVTKFLEESFANCKN